MASSFIANAHQVNFESVLAIPDNEQMLNMFRALEASGLRGFLGCQSVLYEQELEQFFDTALVQDGDITGAVSGKFFSISQSRFAEVFDLPTEGLVDFSEVPKNLVYDARSIFSKSGEPVSTYGKKKVMKYEYRLLNDILSKAITVKAGSLDAVTNERFLMMTAIQFGLKVNWSKILFSVLKETVDKTQKKAKGYAAQICVLLKSDPAITMGEAVPFPTSKVLSIKTVHTYIAMNQTIDARGQSDEPGMAPVAIVKRKSKSKKESESTVEAPVEVVTEVVSKKRPTVAGDEPVVPKKRSTVKSKAPPSKASLDMVNVAQEVVPLTIIEPTPAATAEKSPLPKHKSKKRKLVLPRDSDDETVEERVTVATIEDVDQQVLVETYQMGKNEAEQLEQTFDETNVEEIFFEDTAVEKSDNFEQWLDESYEKFVATETVDKAEGNKDIVGAKAPEKAVGRNQTDEELMSIDDLLMQISNNMMLSSQLCDLALANNSLQEWYRKEELLERSPTLPRTYQTTVGNDGNSPEKLTVNSTRVRRTEVDNQDNISLTNKLSDLESLRDFKEKEKLMLGWAEADSLEMAVRRRVYILAKYREMLLRKFLDSHRKCYTLDQPWTVTASQIIDLLSVAHSTSLEDLLEHQKEHGIIMDQPSSSQPFKDFADSSSAVLAQVYSLAKSTCWIRPMVLIDGVWMPIQGNDYWRIVAGYLFLDIVVISSVVDILEKLPTGFCRVIRQDRATKNFVGFFSDLDVQSELESSPEIDLVSSDGSTIYRSPSPQFDSFQEADSSGPNVQLALADYQSSLPATSTAPSVFLDALQTFISQRLDNQSQGIRKIDESQKDVLSRINTHDKGLRDTLRQKDETFRKLIQSARQDGRTLDDVQTLQFNEFRKGVLAHSASVTTDLMDVRKEVKEINVKVTSLDEQVAATRNDLLDFSAKAQETLNIITDHLSELVVYINRGGDKKRGKLVAEDLIRLRMIKVGLVEAVETEVVMAAGVEETEVDILRKDI
ncbi:hypothetical protein F511_12497 [Dorcoceras hygrometricum]|uniref:Dystroglycan-like n=1 Tax=Dorcoceras hygrometricum TaxID=472368 RepID=A0A2Z7ATK9_9LAMI|nr:hypothetical protein F511_12497 [Dorcoceras hygrometricum]